MKITMRLIIVLSLFVGSLTAMAQQGHQLTKDETGVIDKLLADFPGIEREIIATEAEVRKASIHDRVREIREDKESKLGFDGALSPAEKEKYLRLFEQGSNVIEIVSVTPDPSVVLKMSPLHYGRDAVPSDGSLRVTIRYVLSTVPEGRIGYWPRVRGDVAAGSLWPGYWIFTRGCGQFQKSTSFEKPSFVDEIDARIYTRDYSNELGSTSYRPDVPWKVE